MFDMLAKFITTMTFEAFVGILFVVAVIWLIAKCASD